MHYSRIAILCLVVFSACVPPSPLYIVSRGVPLNPTFAVVPVRTDWDEDDAGFASKIESYAVLLGVRVVNRPGTKEVVTTKGAGSASTGSVQILSLTESFLASDETPADYFIFTYATEKRVRFVRKTTHEVLATFVLDLPGEDQAIRLMYDLFRGLGVQIPPLSPGEFDSKTSTALFRSYHNCNRWNLFPPPPPCKSPSS